ncbi:hypothetical protein LTR66_008086 [Elasticomyces elasticus]|nr:hypothetical protein LTR66_008086 [Elasticomyces elasticus]
MDTSPHSSASASRSSTPNPRFASQQSTAEDILKSQTVGLVHLSDFRKRRAEVLELHDGGASGATTPKDGNAASKPLKKIRKAAKKGGLSFGDDEEDGDTCDTTTATMAPRSNAPDALPPNGASIAPSDSEDTTSATLKKRRLGPNASILYAPKALTKSALLREAQMREQLRKEYLLMQEDVRATDILIPFVFYDGTNVPGGSCRVKKGDNIWLFLDRARKIGAELGVGAGNEGGTRGKGGWARVGVDDLMMVRGDTIIPHHYEFYHFIKNHTHGFNGPLFPYSDKPTAGTPTTPSASEPSTPSDVAVSNPLSVNSGLALNNGTKSRKDVKKSSTIPDSELEGYGDDPTMTKLVDRRWYEKNKHIYPASVWADFDPAKDYSKERRKDTEGNAYFFSA